VIFVQKIITPNHWIGQLTTQVGNGSRWRIGLTFIGIPKLEMMGSRGRGASESIARCALQSLEAFMRSIGQPGDVLGAWQHADNDNELGGPAKPAPCMQPSNNKFTSEGYALKMGK
jgi:hypothetical protein